MYAEISLCNLICGIMRLVKLKMFEILVLLLAFICVLALPAFRQNAYELIYERMEVIDYNRNYYSYFKIHNFKQNRTQAASNVTYTLIRDVPSHVKIQIQAYKFASNEYRDFPVLFSYSYCQGLLRDDFGMQAMFKCGNSSVAKICPVMKKMTHFFCNFKTNSENFPPNVPEGSYKVDIKFFHGDTEIIFMQGYGTIKNKAWW